MPEINLSDALAALVGDLRRATSGTAVEVELGLLVREDHRGVRWSVAAPGDTATHRIRFTVHPWQPQPGPTPATSSTAARPYPQSAPVEGTHLPPIVRPRPGIDADRDGD